MQYFSLCFFPPAGPKFEIEKNPKSTVQHTGDNDNGETTTIYFGYCPQPHKIRISPFLKQPVFDTNDPKTKKSVSASGVLLKSWRNGFMYTLGAEPSQEWHKKILRPRSCMDAQVGAKSSLTSVG